MVILVFGTPVSNNVMHVPWAASPAATLPPPANLAPHSHILGKALKASHIEHESSDSMELEMPLGQRTLQHLHGRQVEGVL